MIMVHRGSVMVEKKKFVEEILEFFHKEAEMRGQLDVPISVLYKKFEKEVTYHNVQRAIEFLVDRDLIAPSSYALTAKGRRDHGLRQKT
jgi:Zn-dependent M32 family carboxypeptidase